MRIYIASFFDTKERLLPYAAKIRDMGYELTSTWLKENHKDEHCPKLTEGLKAYYGWRDLKELDYTDLMIIDTFDVTPRGGREVEMGYAMAQNIPIWLVGPVRNVFHRLVPVKAESWDEILTILGERTYALHTARR